jgi:hypothetical protein
LRFNGPIFLNGILAGILAAGLIATFHKNPGMPAVKSQPLLFSGSQIPPQVRYEQLFCGLPDMSEKRLGRGRPAVCRTALLRGLVYKALRRLPTLSDLVFEFHNNPSVTIAVGLSPFRPPPPVERFSSFLRNTPNEWLQAVREELLAQLLHEGAITAAHLSLDSCPILSPVKENNLKTAMRTNRLSRDNPPIGDPEAGLGVICHYPAPGKKAINYFWGYRNHILSDAETELPLQEVTHPANVSELPPARAFLRWAKENIADSVEVVTADAGYDVEDILAFILDELAATPVVPRNARRSHLDDRFSVQGDKMLCPAGLPMVNRGKMTVKRVGITYRQYGCALHWSKRMAQKHLFCPVQHPKFNTQKGCYTTIRLSPAVRSRIDYGSTEFTREYARRTNVERVFSRLLAIAAQQPTVRGLNATRNHVTVAHISVLLVALTAHRTGHPDKLRFVRTFVPNFLTGAANQRSELG